MEEKITLTQYLLGGLDPVLFIACVWFAALGIAAALLVQSLFRNKKSEKTPKEFSWKFLFYDNWRKALLTVILVYLSIVFSYNLFGLSMTTWVACLIGFGYDNLLKVWKDKRQDMFTPNRDELTQRINNK